MRIATYNVEWFASLFDNDNQLFDDDAPSARHGVTRAQQTAALGAVFRALDADAVMVIEAPNHGRRQSTVAALTLFAERFGLRAREVVMGFANDTQQEIALLYDPDRLSARHCPRETPIAPRFDRTAEIAVGSEGVPAPVVFSKPPLEVEVTTEAGFTFQMIGVHLKSKAPHGVKDPAALRALALANRRKQMAQAVWLRRRIEGHLAEARPVMVLGDLNDGPGFDEHERLLGHSSVEIVTGQGEDMLFDPHAQAVQSPRPTPSSARFWIAPERRYLSAMLDYIMVSPPFRTYAPRWRIWHPLDDPQIAADARLRAALLAASDHFPVTLDIDL